MKYRLVDHEGNDIATQELIDRYLSNPEICFKEPIKKNEKSEDIATPPLVCSNKKTAIRNDVVEKSSIDIKGISGSQILTAPTLLLRRVVNTLNTIIMLHDAQGLLSSDYL